MSKWRVFIHYSCFRDSFYYVLITQIHVQHAYHTPASVTYTWLHMECLEQPTVHVLYPAEIVIWWPSRVFVYVSETWCGSTLKCEWSPCCHIRVWKQAMSCTFHDSIHRPVRMNSLWRSLAQHVSIKVFGKWWQIARQFQCQLLIW